jgi:hypothetical protein
MGSGKMRPRNVVVAVCVAGTLLWPVASFGEDQDAFTSTADYVRGCGGPNVSIDCIADLTVVRVDRDDKDSKGQKYCVPDTSAPNMELANAKFSTVVVRLVGWLGEHPEYSEKPYADGLSAAMAAVYPCQ